MVITMPMHSEPVEYLETLINDHAIEAVVFDCDGTLVDTMPAHYDAWVHALDYVNAPFELTHDQYRQWGGISSAKVIKMLCEEFSIELDGERLTKAKQAYLVERLSDTKVIPHIAELARKLSATHPICVASGGHPNNVRKSLDAAGIGDLFPDEKIITPFDVTHGKPAPDMFLLAAERMKSSPAKTLVFEDGPPGIEGAKSAGMPWVFLDHSGQLSATSFDDTGVQ